VPAEVATQASKEGTMPDAHQQRREYIQQARRENTKRAKRRDRAAFDWYWERHINDLMLTSERLKERGLLA
jgi:hypothetical protein